MTRGEWLSLGALVLFFIALWSFFILFPNPEHARRSAFIATCLERHDIRQCEAFWRYERTDLVR